MTDEFSFPCLLRVIPLAMQVLNMREALRNKKGKILKMNQKQNDSLACPEPITQKNNHQKCEMT